MKKKNVDWHQLNEEYERSGLTILEFCSAKGIALGTFRNKRYEIMKREKESGTEALSPPLQPRFKKYNVTTEYRVCLDEAGNLTIHGISPDHFVSVVRALYAAS